MPSFRRRPSAPAGTRRGACSRGLLAVALAPAAAASDYPAGLRRASTRTPRWWPRSPRSPPPTRRSSGAFSIGESHDGRDAAGREGVATTSPRTSPSPRSCSTGCTHGNEPMSLEMTLAILRWLTDGYGTDDRITGDRERPRDVDRVRGQPRRPARTTTRAARSATGARTGSRTPGRRPSGTDLNRNYGYRWGGSGSSSSPSSIEVPRAGAVLRPRDAGDARLPREPGRRRAAADPGRDLVPRVRPAT